MYMYVCVCVCVCMYVCMNVGTNGPGLFLNVMINQLFMLFIVQSNIMVILLLFADNMIKNQKLIRSICGSCHVIYHVSKHNACVLLKHNTCIVPVVAVTWSIMYPSRDLSCIHHVIYHVSIT